MKSIHMMFRVEPDALADALLELDHSDLIDLIKMVDSIAADYDFTKQLRDHFISEVEKEDAHD